MIIMEYAAATAGGCVRGGTGRGTSSAAPPTACPGTAWPATTPWPPGQTRVQCHDWSRGVTYWNAGLVTSD